MLRIKHKKENFFLFHVAWSKCLLVPRHITYGQHSEECMCRLRNIAMRDYQESVTTWQTHRQTDRWTDAGRSDPYVPLCFAGETKITPWTPLNWPTHLIDLSLLSCCDAVSFCSIWSSSSRCSLRLEAFSRVISSSASSICRFRAFTRLFILSTCRNCGSVSYFKHYLWTFNTIIAKYCQ